MLPIGFKHRYDVNVRHDSRDLSALALEKFLRYVRVHTASAHRADRIPSTERQWSLARTLRSELRELGVEHVALTEHCYVYARIAGRGRAAAVEPLLFLAHIDTAPDASGEHVEPRVWTEYDGGTLELGHGTVLDPAEHPELSDYIGEAIVTAGGDTLLGADDKAGVAEIMTLAQILLSGAVPSHPPVEIVFTPDEEVGRGADKIPRAHITARFAITLDGGARGSIETECFHAIAATVSIDGRVMHPGYAKNKLVNAIVLAQRFLAMIPESESPRATDGIDGFYCPTEITGGMQHAEIQFILRDFERDRVERRLAALQAIGRAIEAVNPPAKVHVTGVVQYQNMREELQRWPAFLDLIRSAIRAVGLTPRSVAIRGGTDGARLTEMGLPTPNLFAGGFNFHSVYEWVPVIALGQAVAVCLEIVQRWPEALDDLQG